MNAEILLTTYAADARRVLAKHIRCAATLDDVWQETCIKVLKNFDEYDQCRKPVNWLVTIARNVFIDMNKKRRPTSLSENTPERCYNADNDTIREETCQRVREVVESVSDVYRETIKLALMEGMPYDEIASKLGVSVGTVKSRVSRGKAELAEKLKVAGLA